MFPDETFDLPFLPETNAAVRSRVPTVKQQSVSGGAIPNALAALRLTAPDDASAEALMRDLARRGIQGSVKVVPPQSNAPSVPTALAGRIDSLNAEVGRQQDLEQQLSAPPDYSGLQDYARTRSQNFLPMALSAALLGRGPEGTQPLAKIAAQETNELFSPIKVEGGHIDASGTAVIDPGFQRTKQLEATRNRILQLDRQITSATSEQERQFYQNQQRQQMEDFKRMQFAADQRHKASQLDIQNQLLDIRRDKADGTLTPNQRFTVEDRMGDDYRKLIEDDRKGLAATQQIAVLPTDRKLNSTEQGALVYMLNKFLDPGSVVREGEYDRAARAQGMIERAGMVLERLQKGDFLTPRMVEEVRAMAKLYETAAGSRIGAHALDFQERATRRGLDPRGVIGSDARYIPATPQPVPGVVAPVPGAASAPGGARSPYSYMPGGDRRGASGGF